MKFFSILTAGLVTLFLYLFIFERETLFEFSGRAAEPEAQSVAENGGQSKADGESAPIVSVVAVHSLAQSVDDAVLLRGQTEESRRIDVKAETSARVVSERSDKGTLVEKGDVLCRLDPGVRPARLAEAKARLAEAQINFTAASKLMDQGYASQTHAASAKAALQSALSAVKAAETEIENLEIRAPFSGILETDTAERGSLLQPGAPCATIVQLDPIKLVGFVPETDVSRIKIGAMAAGRMAAGQNVVGRVSFLARRSDPLTRTFRVEIEVENAELSLRSGQTAEILIQTDAKSAHLLPQSALTLNDEGSLGLRLVDKDNTVRFAPVKLLRDTTDGVWLGGLPDKADVIISGQEYVVDGVKVSVTWQEAAK